MTEKIIAPGIKSRNPTQEELDAFMLTPEFMDWFGDWQADPEQASKIVDDVGRPLVVYAGQVSGIEEFHGDARDRTGSDETGYYFTKDWKTARFFAQTKRDPVTDGPIAASIYACLLNVRNPKLLEPAGAHESTRVVKPPIGYDGYINDLLKEIVVFDPSQIIIVGETPIEERHS